MLLNILDGAPVWVWPLLLLLVLFGFRATRSRQISRRSGYVLAGLGAIGLGTVAELPDPVMAWSGFGIGYFVGVATGYKLQTKWIMETGAQTVTVRGEWFTLLSLMIMFWSNFANGFVEEVHPAIHGTAAFQLLFTLAIGWVSGCFLGRTIRILRSRSLSR